MDKAAPVDPRVHELIRRRWSPRAFADRPVDPPALRSLLQAAQWAPSSYNEQPWAFVVATRDAPESYERLMGCLVPYNQNWAKSAPVLAVSVAKAAFDRNGKPNLHAFHDVGLAVAQLTLQATAEGLAVHQMAGFDADRARRALEIPDGWDPVAAIALGHPADPETLPPDVRDKELAERERKPLSEFVFSGTWGEPASAVTART